jgi:hypothetical protein
MRALGDVVRAAQAWRDALDGPDQGELADAAEALVDAVDRLAELPGPGAGG